MAGGVIGLGKSYTNDATSTFGALAGMEARRNNANDTMEAQKDAQTASNIGTGAGIGMVAGGPVGAGVGAAIGWLASELF